MNALEFTELMKLFLLFIAVLFIFGLFEEHFNRTEYFIKIAATCSIILMFWFFIHNAIIIYNNEFNSIHINNIYNLGVLSIV